MDIRLTYFKHSGKYYSEGTLSIHDEPAEWPMFRIFEHVNSLLNLRLLPGLIQGHSAYYVHVDPLEHPHGYPGLVVPHEWREP